MNLFNKTHGYLNKKNYHQIVDLQKRALVEVFKNKKFQFRNFIVKKSNEQTLGMLFSYFALETILIANFNNINPYNQPAVEQVKIKTRNLLK